MPDRIVRQGILTSDAVNTLTWPAEVFYRRLMSVVDDYGRFDGRIAIIRAALYPLKLSSVSDSDIGKWMTECVDAALVRAYCVENREYMELLKFRQRIQGKAKWPEPVENEPPRKSTVNHRESPLYSETYSESKTKTHSDYSPEFEEFWKVYPRKVGKGDAWSAWKKIKNRPELSVILDRVAEDAQSEQWQTPRYIPHPSTWLNERRWEDEPPALIPETDEDRANRFLRPQGPRKDILKP